LKNKKILKIKNREKIFNFIDKYPGVHLRMIFSKLDMSDGTIRYHINYLIRKKLIFNYKKDGYTRYYVNKTDNIKNKSIISFLRNKNTRAIIVTFYLLNCASLTTISKELDKDKKDISNHLKRLIEDGIIEQAPIEESYVLPSYKNGKKMKYNLSNAEKMYRLKEPYELYDLLVLLRDNFLDDGSTKESLDFLKWLYKIRWPTILQNSKDTYKRIEEIMYDVCPHPYHV
jgi:DNA-binding transcriptional ArsR family regulator